MQKVMKSIDSSVDPILLSKVRDQFLNEYKLHRDLYDECDVERVRETDWTVKRFLIACESDVEKSFAMLRDCMRWRKSYGINTRTDLDYPTEFYKIGALFPYRENKDGNVVIYIRIKLHKKLPKFTDFTREFFVHVINKVDTKVGESGWSMIWDCTDVGPSNWDVSMLRFLISTIKNYFPRGMTYAIMYGVPKMMAYFASLGLKLVPEETRNKIKFVTNSDLFLYVPEENVPDFMGGKCEVSYREVPTGVRDGKDIGIEKGFSLQEIEAIRKHYQKYLGDD